MTALLRSNSGEFQRDYSARINPELMNQLMYKAVPVLKHTGWQITSVRPGFAETILPLNTETTNQHGTHQAALISLSADYTGGMALTTLLTGVPLAGIHKCKSEESASLWLASMNVKYVRPSTGHLTGRCQISDELQKKIRERYFQGKRVLVTLPIEFSSNGHLVAEAELRYFAQPTIQLLNATGKVSTLFSQKLKASARMIAGVRASHEPKSKIRVDCPHAAVAAGPHGALLANKLRQALPQLTDMVLARTKHIDQMILNMNQVEQVVLLGAGLDMRPFRIAQNIPNISYFEVDLPEMLSERERVIELLKQEKNLPEVERHSIPANFLNDDVYSLILQNSSFDPTRPTAFIYEGCSMYFSKDENHRLLESIWELAQHPDSKIWCDLVTSSVVKGETNRPEVAQFLSKMDDLGEAFIFGADDPTGFVRSIGCQSATSQTCQQYLETEEPIFDVYQFCVGSK